MELLQSAQIFFCVAFHIIGTVYFDLDN